MNAPVSTTPDHVPSRLVYDYDYFTAPQDTAAPHWTITRKLAAEAPPIFYTPRNGGHWIVTRGSDAVEMFRRPDIFSSDPQYNSRTRLNPTRHLPLQYDPPEHADGRRIFAPLFSPGAVLKMEPFVRDLAAEIIDNVLQQGHCEFVGDVAELFPVNIFLSLADHTLDDREALVDMAARHLRAQDPDVARSGMRDLANYLDSILEGKRRRPGTDLLSRIVTATFLDRELTHQEQLGAAVFMFLAGLDTVAAMMSWTMAFLAEHPDHYRSLVENPEAIKNAVEELCRVSGVAMPSRACAQDHDYNGIAFKKGDRISYLLQISGMNDPSIANAEEVDFTRELSPHLIFGSGPHRCLGSHLARLEIRVFLEEWIKRIPHFSIASGQSVKSKGGTVWVPESLPLQWPIKANTR